MEAGDNTTQKPPSAEDLARQEHYAAMMEAIARDIDEDFGLDEDESARPDEVGFDSHLEMLKAAGAHSKAGQLLAKDQ